MRTWFEQAKSVLMKPTKFFKKMPVKGGYGDPISFAAINFLLYGLLSGLVIGYGAMPGYLILFVVMFVLFGIVGVFISSAIYHIMAMIVGGKGKYEATARVISYVSVTTLFSWIPIVNIAAIIYSIYLQVLGFSQVHKISHGRAAVMILIPLLLAVIFVLAALTSFAGGYLGAFYALNQTQ